MGIGGVSATSLILILLIVLLLFGTKKLRNIGKDLGEGIKGFKKGLEDRSDEKHEVDDAEFSEHDDQEEKSDKVKRDEHV